MVFGDGRSWDWFPLVGGDPCPGDPEGWTVVVAHWEQRAEDMERLRRDHVVPHTSIDAEGNRFRRMEGVFAELGTMLEFAAGEFGRAAETVREWQVALRSMQARADEALIRARRAQERLEEAQRAGSGVWGGEMASLQWEIQREQQEVDEIRAEYDRTVAVFRDRYQIRSLEVLYARDPGRYPHGSPWASSEMVLASLNGLDPATAAASNLRKLAAKADQSPEDLERFLKALEQLSPEQMTTYLSMWPELAYFPLAVSNSTVENTVLVKNWWARLSEGQRNSLVNHASGMVGNLDGIPYEVRDEANRAVLSRVLNDSNNWRQKAEVDIDISEETREKLEHIRQVLEEAEKDLPRYLTSLDLSNLKPENEDDYGYNDVLASVSLGDIDEADKVSVVVPGMDNKATSMRDLATAGTNTYNEQVKAKREHGDSVQKHAVELWIGYETPPDLKAQATRPDKWVTKKDLAVEGGKKLAAHLDGMNVTKSDHSSGDYSDPSISVIAHSYGTTTMGEATQYAETNVDSIVMYGSAGISDEAVADANGDGWNVDRDSEGRQKIYYTDSGEDWTAPMGHTLGGRETPDAIDDAQRFQSTEGISADGQYYEDVDTHDFVSHDKEQGYVNEKTTSLYYGARAALGYEEYLEKRFYESWYNVNKGGPRGEFRMDVKPEYLKDGRVPEDTMKDVRRSQDIPGSELVGGEDVEGD